MICVENRKGINLEIQVQRRGIAEPASANIKI